MLEPYTIFAKGIRQAFEAQRRLKVWKPQKAAVTGEVTTFARNPKPDRNASLIESLGAR